MARQSTEIVNANFSKGFITETAPLGYPENSCKDISNLVLERNGSVRVRNGLVVPDFGTSIQKSNTAGYSLHYWESAGNTDTSFLVVHNGPNIECLAIEGEQIGDNTIIADTLVDNDGLRPTRLTDIAVICTADRYPETLSSEESRGRLYLTSAETGPFYLEYLPEGRANNSNYDEAGNTDTQPCVQIVLIEPKYRDLSGLNSGVPVDVRPTEEIPEHHYNILNAGWPESDYQLFFRGKGAPRYPDFGGGEYPALADYYWSGWSLNQNQNTPEYEEFLPALIKRRPIYNTPASMGHFILNVYEHNRTEVSNVGGLPIERETVGPTQIGLFSGRTWYAGFSGAGFEDNILFSNVLPLQASIAYNEEKKRYIDTDAGQCYQKNDPTARDINDLVDDDGGVVTIPGVGKVQALVSLKNALVVVSDKGAWAISGGIDPFSANNYAVNKITNVGCVSSDSVVELEGSLAYWGYGDIVVLSETTSSVGAQSLTDTTIKTFYLDINLTDKRRAYGHYDIVDKKIYWSYGAGLVLIYDTVLQAFSKYAFAASKTTVEQDIPARCQLVPEEQINRAPTNIELVNGAFFSEQNRRVLLCTGESSGDGSKFRGYEDTDEKGNHYRVEQGTQSNDDGSVDVTVTKYSGRERVQIRSISVSVAMLGSSNAVTCVNYHNGRLYINNLALDATTFETLNKISIPKEVTDPVDNNLRYAICAKQYLVFVIARPNNFSITGNTYSNYPGDTDSFACLMVYNRDTGESFVVSYSGVLNQLLVDNYNKDNVDNSRIKDEYVVRPTGCTVSPDENKIYFFLLQEPDSPVSIEERLGGSSPQISRFSNLVPCSYDFTTGNTDFGESGGLLRESGGNFTIDTSTDMNFVYDQESDKLRTHLYQYEFAAGSTDNPIYSYKFILDANSLDLETAPDDFVTRNPRQQINGLLRGDFGGTVPARASAVSSDVPHVLLKEAGVNDSTEYYLYNYYTGEVIPTLSAFGGLYLNQLNTFYLSAYYEGDVSEPFVMASSGVNYFLDYTED